MWFYNVRIVTSSVNEGFSYLQDSSQKYFCYNFKTEIDKITEKKLLKLKGKHDITEKKLLKLKGKA